MGRDMQKFEQIPNYLDDLAAAFIRLLEKIEDELDRDDLKSIVLPALRGSAALCEAGLMSERTLDALWQTATRAPHEGGGDRSETAPKLRLVAGRGGAFQE